MTKQEFLAMSLPYGLKMCYTYENRIDIQTLLPMHFDCKCQLVNERGKPVLRPPSDLTKPIEHNGEKFVPIVELVKMVFDSPFSDPFCFKSGSYYVARCKEYEFGYNHKEYSFYLFDLELVNFKFLPNQLGLFKKLIEWHFAVGLNSDDYIDLNSLEANPYKQQNYGL